MNDDDEMMECDERQLELAQGKHIQFSNYFLLYFPSNLFLESAILSRTFFDRNNIKRLHFFLIDSKIIDGSILIAGEDSQYIICRSRSTAGNRMNQINYYLCMKIHFFNKLLYQRYSYY